jgi:hypothetical protein
MFMNSTRRTSTPYSWHRGTLWLGFLGPFSFLSYGFANSIASQHVHVPGIVFDWEQKIPFIAWTTVALAMSLLAISANAKPVHSDCRYGELVSPDGRSVENLQFQFIYDGTGDKGVVIGSNGTADVEVNVGPEGVTFLEQLVSGAAQLTTIDRYGTSVHSRHTLAPNGLIPTQHYGRCTQN